MSLYQSGWCAITEWQVRSEEHTSELQSQSNLVCRLLLEKKKNKGLTAGTCAPERSEFCCLRGPICLRSCPLYFSGFEFLSAAFAALTFVSHQPPSTCCSH